ncbi:unnamed protein product [Rhizoctonia solani]|uniref:Inhibitor I9 domain-containing protein n=1 Tax=Rhizoctonia solani TaxID=456999 RepID=A0A8H2X4F1_9AGAM|nr:unnamed protein product [Rhizoctonia solani]
MRTAFVVSALTFIVPALSAPTIIPITKRAGPIKLDSYIVKFKPGVSQDRPLSNLAEKLRNSGSSITYNYAPLWDGFSATLKGSDLEYVRGMHEIESVEADSIMSVDYEEDSSLGLGSSVASERRRSLIDWGDHPSAPAPGHGVTVYGIDTGIYTNHSCFEGRATPGPSFVDGEEDSNDLNGHGTRTAVGKGYSLAKGAKIIGVKGKSFLGL